MGLRDWERGANVHMQKAGEGGRLHAGRDAVNSLLLTSAVYCSGDQKPASRFEQPAASLICARLRAGALTSNSV